MRAISTRDAGLALISQIKRWMVAGAVMLTGAFSLLAANAFRGHARTSNAGASSVAGSTAASQSASSAAASQSQSQSSSDGTGLQQPANTPAPASSAPAPVVSGGS